MPSDTKNSAPGAPGVSARWTSSRKEGVGTARNNTSRVWFTLSHGIVNEVYYPRVDRACTRDMELVVTDGREFFSEEKRDADAKIGWMAKGVPAFDITNMCKQGRYEIKKQVLADPYRHTLLQKIVFRPRQGRLEDFHLYALLAPHLHNHGGGNTGWVGEFKGLPMLMAKRDGSALALACSAPWLKRSVGYVGTSDGWQDLKMHKQMEWEYSCAEKGNVCLTGEIDIASCDGEFLLALGFGRSASEAGHRVRSSLLQGFEVAWQQYRQEWADWQKTLRSLDGKSNSPANYHASTAVLATHEAKDFPGGMIASLSIPWGGVHGDNDLGGYHLVWPRDAYESCGAMLAAGAAGEAQRALDYFEVTQEPDGHWPQNMWLDGREYWKGIQLDETAAPILLLDLARREKLTDLDRDRLWPMIRGAAGFIMRNGPGTQLDRWEEDPGYSSFTLASEVAALLVAADMAAQEKQGALAEYLRQTADAWNDSIEDWIYARNTELARKLGVEGYYVRITPEPLSRFTRVEEAMVSLKNRPLESSNIRAVELVSPDALALVRFGLRAADDPRILNTIKVVDALLKFETRYGPAWHRYNQDGYGEHEDGSPFDGTGVGRAWPLLTGERAHYELAAGHVDEARRLLIAMESFADKGGMIPEQIWDTDDLPQAGLYHGRPSGSARPLVWAHAEYIKLLRSLQEGRVFDMPPQTVERYLKQKTQSPLSIWRFTCQTRTIPPGRQLRIETAAPAQIHWTDDEWAHVHDVSTGDSGLGIHFADLPKRPESTRLTFTFYWPEAGRWEGKDFTVAVKGTT